MWSRICLFICWHFFHVAHPFLLEEFVATPTCSFDFEWDGWRYSLWTVYPWECRLFGWAWADQASYSLHRYFYFYTWTPLIQWNLQVRCTLLSYRLVKSVESRTSQSAAWNNFRLSLMTWCARAAAFWSLGLELTDESRLLPILINILMQIFSGVKKSLWTMVLGVTLALVFILLLARRSTTRTNILTTLDVNPPALLPLVARWFVYSDHIEERIFFLILSLLFRRCNIKRRLKQSLIPRLIPHRRCTISNRFWGDHQLMVVVLPLTAYLYLLATTSAWLIVSFLLSLSLLFRIFWLVFDIICNHQTCPLWLIDIFIWSRTLRSIYLCLIVITPILANSANMQLGR